MLKSEFKLLYDDFKQKVEQVGKKDPSLLMGYVYGLGKRKLTGYQFGSLLDLLLVHPDGPVVTGAPDAAPPSSNIKTLAQR